MGAAEQAAFTTRPGSWDLFFPAGRQTPDGGPRMMPTGADGRPRPHDGLWVLRLGNTGDRDVETTSAAHIRDERQTRTRAGFRGRRRRLEIKPDSPGNRHQRPRLATSENRHGDATTAARRVADGSSGDPGFFSLSRRWAPGTTDHNRGRDAKKATTSGQNRLSTFAGLSHRGAGFEGRIRYNQGDPTQTHHRLRASGPTGSRTVITAVCRGQSGRGGGTIRRTTRPFQ